MLCMKRTIVRAAADCMSDEKSFVRLWFVAVR